MKPAEELWKVFKEGSDPVEKASAKKDLITLYIKLVKIISSKLYNYYSSNIEYDDLMGYGVIGLIDAIDKFDLDKKIKFETYASIRIRGAVIDQIRNLDWIPRSIRQKSKILKDAQEELEKILMREPTMEELATHLKKSGSEIQAMVDETSLYNILSIEDELSDNYKIQIPDQTVESSPEEYTLQQDTLEQLSKALDDLPERERLIINLYYYEGLTYKEIGEVFKISESRVSQIHSKSLARMRKGLTLS